MPYTDFCSELEVLDDFAMFREVSRILQRAVTGLDRNRRRVVTLHDFEHARQVAETLFNPQIQQQQQQQQQQQRQRRRDNILSRLDLARRLVNACPTASLGYLHYARIMEEQGQYEAAVRVYDNALEKVHKGDPYIQNLQPRRLELVSQYLNLRTLGRLPVEIIDYIMLNFLSVTDRVHCAQTCKAWKHMIMDSNVMWQDIDFRKLNPRMLFYQLYNKSLRKITLGYSSRFTLLCPTGVVIPSRSNYIEELVLDLGTARFYTEPDFHVHYYSITTRLLDLLRLNSQSLTSVQINCEDDLFIPTILENCSNLTHLSWRIFYWAQPPEVYIPWRETAGGPWMLKHLSIDVADLRFVTQDTLQLISKCPHLETLYLYTANVWTTGELYDRGSFLQTLNQYCRQLRRVDFVHKAWKSPREVENAPCSFSNIHHVTARAADAAFPVLARLASGLQTLAISISYISIEQWTILDHIGGFPQLQTLELWWDDLDAALLPVTFQVLSKSQRIETVRIHRSRMVDDITFPFLQSLTQLRCLEFHGTLGFNPEALHAYVFSSSTQYLQYLTLCNRPPYRRVLEDNNNYQGWRAVDLGQLLPLFASLPCLRYLNIESLTGTMNEQVATAFISAIRSDRLCRIKLKTGLSFEGLQLLVSLPTLNDLHLEFFDMIVEDLMFSQVHTFQELLLHNSPHLRRVIINNRLDAEPYMKFIDI